MEKVIVIIPAYNPNEKLIELVEKIDNQIIVINDGSREEREYIFKKISNKAIILKNEKNRGKGYSLKKGFKYVEENLKKDIIGVITADADGQHAVEDIKKVKKRIKENYNKNEEKIILGSRNFKKKEIPIKNKIGNMISSYIFKKKSGVIIKDTQTGLRGIPKKYLREVQEVKGEGFEYEQNMLKNIVTNNIEYEELEIQTIYNKNNESNFKIFKDSYKVVKSILK